MTQAPPLPVDAGALRGRPPVPAPFRWDGPLLAIELAGVAARFSGRASGSVRAARSTAPGADRGSHDDAASRRRLAARVGIPVTRWAQGRQVHGTVVRQVTDERTLADDDHEDADGQALTLCATAGVVLSADCLAVVVGGGSAVAVLHAGWRGLAGGVLEEGVRALRELGAHGPLEAAIGPGAGGCCYEVGPDVRAALVTDGVLGTDAQTPIDLKAIAARRLHAAGVVTVHDCSLCTICAADAQTGERLFFSHRADGGATGRQAAIAWLRRP